MINYISIDEKHLFELKCFNFWVKSEQMVKFKLKNYPWTEIII